MDRSEVVAWYEAAAQYLENLGYSAVVIGGFIGWDTLGKEVVAIRTDASATLLGFALARLIKTNELEEAHEWLPERAEQLNSFMTTYY